MRCVGLKEFKTERFAKDDITKSPEFILFFIYLYLNHGFLSDLFKYSGDLRIYEEWGLLTDMTWSLLDGMSWPEL